MDAYAVLGLRPGATKEQIKARYRELARQWHPDRNKDPGAGAKMQEINRAYEMICNGQSSTHYTPPHKRQREQSGDPFGFAGQKEREDILRKNSFFDQQWAENLKKEFERYRYTNYWDAGGTHTNARPMKKCPHCNGSGEIPA